MNNIERPIVAVCVITLLAILIFVPPSSNDEIMQLKIERTKLEIKILKLECKK